MSTPEASDVRIEDWSPVEEAAEDMVTPAAAAALHGLLDAPGPPPGEGTPLPLLWHWLAFLPRVPQAELGPDGHPRRGTFLPPVALPRRMFVGGTVERPADDDAGCLLVGERLHRRGIVEDVRHTQGRSGELVFVTVGYEVTGGTATIHEVQNLVYRPAPGPRAAGAPGAGSDGSEGPDGPDHPGWSMRLDLAIEPTLLFRFSALTYNAHRIHYDRRWAAEHEGYPGLVVHGPLQAVALAELCRRQGGEQAVRSFRFRAISPAFDDGPLLLRGRADPSGGRATLAAFDHRGTQTMTAEAELG